MAAIYRGTQDQLSAREWVARNGFAVACAQMSGVARGSQQWHFWQQLATACALEVVRCKQIRARRGWRVAA